MESSSRPTSNTDTCVYQIDFPAPIDQVERLQNAVTEILAFSNSVSSRYLWHKQSFNLGLTSVNFSSPINQEQHRWLEGKTDVTDAVDDEWFIVWLLQQISIKWSEAVIGIEDDDGEFLLIEAADVLPNWVTPQNAANRLWIHQGHLHLIPLEHKSELPFAQGEPTMNPSFDPDEDGFIDRNTAVELVRDPNVKTQAPKEVEETVWARISGYPKKAEEHHHKTLTYLPVELALALEDSPHLITEAVGAFYERDPAMLKACNTMTRFPPSSPLALTSDSADSSESTSSLPPTVLVPTRLTRPLYSQLLLQKFYAPKPFEKVGWTEGKLGEEDVRRRDLGMKIACGFEMLYKQTAPLPRLDSTSSTISTLDVSSNPEYQKMLERLKEKGFFEGVGIEGSREWNEREEKAKLAWIQSRVNSPTLSFAQRVDEAITRAKSRTNPVSNRIESPATLTEEKVKSLGVEDSEEWLQIDQAGLEEILKSREGGGNSFEDEGFSSDEDGLDVEDEMDEGEGKGAEKTKEEREEERKNRKAAKRLEEMAGKVEDFVQGRGAVQGAVFDDERSDDGVDSEAEDDEDEEMEMPTMTSEERASRLETLVAPLPVSEWGQQATDSSSAAPPPLSAAPNATPSTKEPRPAKFEAEKYDGASSDSDSSDEAMPGEEGLGTLNEVEEGEDEEEPAVMNEEDMLDMGEEMDEFLKFATETLGLSEAQYQGILGERRQRGAFVPEPAKEKKTNVVPPKSGSQAKSTSPSTSSSSAPAPPPPSKSASSSGPTPRQPSRNPNLADFDSLMEQMEKELSNVRKPTPSSTKSKAVPTASSSAKANSTSSKPGPSSNKVTIETLSDSEGDDQDDEDVEQMDAELQQMLKEMGGEGDGGTMDYNLVKNFLDSFQSQGGFAGPAGNLSGRLGFNLPRNTQ